MATALEYPACPACGESEIPSPFLYETSIFSRGQILGLSRCPTCGVYFTRPRMADHNLQTQDASLDGLIRKYGRYADEGRFPKDNNFRLYLGLAERYLARAGSKPPYSLLDIGAHCGFFLRFASERGWVVAGVEPSAAHVEFARRVLGIDSVEEGYFGDASFGERRFDLITLLDVLEHIANPLTVLAAARSRLTPSGMVLAKVPHLTFYLSWRKPVALLGRAGLLPKFPTFDAAPPPEAQEAKRSGFFDLFEHVVHYDRATATEVFSRAGFDRIELLPAPPTNPPGDWLNVPRTAVYGLARLGRAFSRTPGKLTHGLLIVASPGAPDDGG